ncbi:hypothetical protein OIU77_028215 [Salix suchowensis]|uniref:Uncharacterized protein n=1 Tax=Salix suchowensis TaxID=1278906 RepID=A0ABQ9BGM3_9ROSI|nr:hypothetical protein OIU77_028215 [Salix suchowensis]
MIGSSSDAAAANAATAVAITTRSGKPGYCFGDRGVESNTRYLTEHGLEHHSPNNDQYPFGASAVSNGKLEKHQKADEAFLVFCMQYYCEPGTGQRFHSLICIQKRLSEETSRSAKPGNKRICEFLYFLILLWWTVSNSRLKIQNVPYIFKSRSLFDLPNGWVVERKPCKNIDYAGIIDKHYNELETGKLFRSLRSVERDLTEGKKHIVTLEALKAEDHFIPFESSGSRKEHVSSKKVETAMLDPSSIPAKIKWVLGGPGGIVWNPFMDDHLVPGFIKQKCIITMAFGLCSINTMAFGLNGHRLIEDVLTDSWQHASGAAWKSRA